MPSVDIVVESPLSRSPRVRQLESMFDVPPEERCKLEWHGNLPIESEPWNIGLIVGPSGCGKSTIARQLFGEHIDFDWSASSVIDCFPSTMKIDEISGMCQAVGFNTVPAWMRPHSGLSTGEKFRVDLARRLVELPDPIVCDEFTSVVDRQVAAIGSHAVQKIVRKQNKKFIAVSCHHDIVDWLQPDWVFEPATMTFTRRLLRRRPEIKTELCRVGYEAWEMFSRYHYLTNTLNRVAACYVLFVDGQPASFAGIMHRPHPSNPNILGVSRNVTLPDWQGLGLAFVLCEAIGAAAKAIGKVLHHYPAHPWFIRSLDRSDKWEMIQRPGILATSGTGGKLYAKTGEEREEVHRVRDRGGIEGNPNISSSSKAAKKEARREAGGPSGVNAKIHGASHRPTLTSERIVAGRRRSGLAASPEQIANDADSIKGVKKLTGNHAPDSDSNFARRGARPCAVFRYVGPAMPDKAEALRFLNGE